MQEPPGKPLNLWPVFIGAVAALVVAAIGLSSILDRVVGKADGESSEVGPRQTAISDAASPKIRSWHVIAEYPKEIAQFESVFWDAADTDTLRAWLKQSDRIAGADILEVGTGTGVVSLVCAELGSRSIVATDTNPAAIKNAKYNAEEAGLSEVIEVRFSASEAGFMPGPFAPVSRQEHFDFIISNPPWEDAPVTSDASMAYYDPAFRLLDALLEESADHLKPGGELLLAYGARQAIRRIQERAPEHGWTVELVDDRDLDTLPEVFLPAMLLRLQRAR